MHQCGGVGGCSTEHDCDLVRRSPRDDPTSGAVGVAATHESTTTYCTPISITPGPKRVDVSNTTAGAPTGAPMGTKGSRVRWPCSSLDAKCPVGALTLGHRIATHPQLRSDSPELLWEDLLHGDRPLVERLGVLPPRDRHNLLFLLPYAAVANFITVTALHFLLLRAALERGTR